MVFNYTNSKFKVFRDDLITHFQQEILPVNNSNLYRLDVDLDELWRVYLDSFPAEIKGVYRENAWHDCSACKKFIKQMGDLCSIDKQDDGDYTVTTLFDFDTIPEYQMIVKALSEYLHSNIIIKDVFLSTTDSVGVDENFEQLSDGTVIKHNHLYLELPSRYVVSGGQLPTILGEYRTNKSVLEKALNEISNGSVDSVLELIRSNNLYRGLQWKNALLKFKQLQMEYQLLTDDKSKELFLWSNSKDSLVTRLGNQSIGVLLKDLTDGMSLDNAIERYNTLVDSSNYQRPKTVYTESMVEKAEAKLTELGFLDSLGRRYATLDDLSLDDCLFIHRSLDVNIGTGLFDELKKDAIHKNKEFNYLPVYTLTEFIDNILPMVKSMSLYFDLNLISNLVSLTTSEESSSKSMFYWGNNFCWSYKGNLADTNIKENVKRMGGDVDVDLRFSIQWNDTGDYDANDLDAHCRLPDGGHIWYNDLRDKATGGWLDIDITHPKKEKVAVENIQFKHRDKLFDGVYQFFVKQYQYRGGDNGFKAEIEFDGKVYSFNYPFRVQQDEEVLVGEVTYDKANDVFSFNDCLTKHIGGLTEYGLNVNTFVPVNVVCWSPNYWNTNEDGKGNKHLFFFLKDCVCKDSVNGYYNEFLCNTLRPYRKVMEALSSKCRALYNPNQLSGVGFSTSIHKDFVLKIVTRDGTEKIIKVAI